MNALKQLASFARKLDFGLNAVGKEFRNVAPFFFRLGLLILFFWYLIESVETLSVHHPVLAGTVGAAALAIFLTFLVITAKGFGGFENAAAEDKEDKGSVLPFLLLNLPFVVAVALADRWYGHVFPGGLLRFTEEILRRIALLFF